MRVASVVSPDPGGLVHCPVQFRGEVTEFGTCGGQGQDCGMWLGGCVALRLMSSQSHLLGLEGPRVGVVGFLQF